MKTFSAVFILIVGAVATAALAAGGYHLRGRSRNAAGRDTAGLRGGVRQLGDPERQRSEIAFGRTRRRGAARRGAPPLNMRRHGLRRQVPRSHLG